MSATKPYHVISQGEEERKIKQPPQKSTYLHRKNCQLFFAASLNCKEGSKLILRSQLFSSGALKTPC